MRAKQKRNFSCYFRQGSSGEFPGSGGDWGPS
jgi:hypothetical protein